VRPTFEEVQYFCKGLKTENASDDDDDEDFKPDEMIKKLFTDGNA
jgi:hypothetical protein